MLPPELTAQEAELHLTNCVNAVSFLSNPVGGYYRTNISF